MIDPEVDLELPGMPARPPEPDPPDVPSTRLQARALLLAAAHLAHRAGAGWGVHEGPTELDPAGWLWLNRQTLEALERRGLLAREPGCTLTDTGLVAVARIVRAPLRT